MQFFVNFSIDIEDSNIENVQQGTAQIRCLVGFYEKIIAVFSMKKVSNKDRKWQ